jgi:hypothetical protein
MMDVPRPDICKFTRKLRPHPAGMLVTLFFVLCQGITAMPASALAGLLGVRTPGIDCQIALGRELFPLDLCCLVCGRSDILYGIGGSAFMPAIIAGSCLQCLGGFPRFVDGDHALRNRYPKPGQSA